MSQDLPENEIAKILDDWHYDAAHGNYDSYFNAMSANSVFIGTDKSENWQVADFKKWSKVHFEDGEAWSFTVKERNIYFSKDNKIAWFDELLDTWMGVCRGSGVLAKENGNWKIKQYVLSVTIDNDKIEEFIKLSQK